MCSCSAEQYLRKKNENATAQAERELQQRKSYMVEQMS